MPPLELTGERTLPDVPEENYWYRRHLAVYEWIAARVRRPARRRHGVRRGLRLRGARSRGAASVVGVDANPEAHEHARLRYVRQNLRFERDLVETFAEPCDAVVFLQTIEHVQNPAAILEHFKAMLAPGGTAYVSTPNVLTLAPPGAERSDNPWHVHEYRAEEFRALCERALRRRSSCSACSTRASCAPTSWRCSSAGTRVHKRLGLTKPFYDRFTPAIAARDFALRGRAHLDRRAGLPGSLPRVSRRPRRGELALVLHTHMPYVEGYGTWPFGEEWLWEAIATCYLPLLDAARARAARR